MRIENCRISKPGLFITGTDTGVGKTVVSCAIAVALREAEPGIKLGVFKPMASGCRREREGLVSEDAEALAHFADSRHALEVINPVRFRAALSPAAAAEQAKVDIDYDAIRRSIERLDVESDLMMVEGVGGVMAPIDPSEPQTTVLDLMVLWDYPVLVVCRAGLGTLNHTALSVAALRTAGLRVAGLVINGLPPDTALCEDASLSSNWAWLEKLTKVPVVIGLPPCEESTVRPHLARLDEQITEQAGLVSWRSFFKPPRKEPERLRFPRD